MTCGWLPGWRRVFARHNPVQCFRSGYADHVKKYSGEISNSKYIEACIFPNLNCSHMKKYTRSAFVISVIAASSFLYAFIIQTTGDLSIVDTTAGKVSGIRNAAGDVISYKGIPFAAPPVGDLRWKAPQPAAHWSNVKKCDAFSASPMQPAPVPFSVYTSEFLIPEKPISEDCLYLNVWTNATSPLDKKPVFVWIYGGAFSSGGSACAIYNGEAAAKKGIVFVSINYRVGIYGFFAHPDLSNESPNKVSGNYGLLDQLAALKWVQANIARFGGNPENVTIGGQSAGSMSVNYLVASPLAKGLFKRAIAESGSAVLKNAARNQATLATAESQGLDLAKKAGISALAAMRAMNDEAIRKQFPVRFGPVIDGYVLPEPISTIFAAGRQNHVSFMTGWNGDEGGIAYTSKEVFIKKAQEQYGLAADTFLTYFPASTEEASKHSQSVYNLDMSFALSGYKWANTESLAAGASVYVYNFNRKVPATGEMTRYGAFHTAEVPYMLDNLTYLNNRPLTAADYSLAQLMSAYWVNFVTTGNPNAPGLAAWPTYETSQYWVKIFDVQPSTEKLPEKAGLDFLLSKAEQ